MLLTKRASSLQYNLIRLIKKEYAVPHPLLRYEIPVPSDSWLLVAFRREDELEMPAGDLRGPSRARAKVVVLSLCQNFARLANYFL